MTKGERKFKVILILAILTHSSRQFWLEEKRKTHLLSPLYITAYKGNLFSCGKRKKKKKYK